MVGENSVKIQCVDGRLVSICSEIWPRFRCTRESALAYIRLLKVAFLTSCVLKQPFIIKKIITTYKHLKLRSHCLGLQSLTIAEKPDAVHFSAALRLTIGFPRHAWWFLVFRLLGSSETLGFTIRHVTESYVTRNHAPIGFTVKTNLCFRYEGERGGQRYLVIFEDTPLWIIISLESSGPDLFINMVVDRFIFKNNQITLSPSFSFIPVTDVGLPETGAT